MIQTKKEYHSNIERMEELLENPENIENKDVKGYFELNLLTDLVADYEDNYYPL